LKLLIQSKYYYQLIETTNRLMTKTNKNSTPSYKAQFEDEYEDFGYEVKNARRYQSKSKRTPKFKDYDDTYDSY
jgi:hypothetical protein